MKLCMLVISVAAFFLTVSCYCAENTKPSEKVWRIMCIGDSITEGGSAFSTYRYPLYKLLTDAGIKFEFVGTRTSRKPFPLKHEGYSGKNVEFLEKTVVRNFKENPADIVLIHAGHNHFADEKPVRGIVAATSKIIAQLQEINPQVIIFVAEVIPSGKLPKYSYILELNIDLKKMISGLPESGNKKQVILVNQAEVFDWKTDAIADKVHPNPQGAQKIASKWFEALKPVMVSNN